MPVCRLPHREVTHPPTGTRATSRQSHPCGGSHSCWLPEAGRPTPTAPPGPPAPAGQPPTWPQAPTAQCSTRRQELSAGVGAPSPVPPQQPEPSALPRWEGQGQHLVQRGAWGWLLDGDTHLCVPLKWGCRTVGTGQRAPFLVRQASGHSRLTAVDLSCSLSQRFVASAGHGLSAQSLGLAAAAEG